MRRSPPRRRHPHPPLISAAAMKLQSIQGRARVTRPSRKRRGAAARAGLQFERTFSTAGVSPFDQVEWDLRTAEITDDSGKAIFKQENVEVPKGWSALATKIAVSKYFYG